VSTRAAQARAHALDTGWRAVAAGPLVALVTLLAAVVVGEHLGLSVRDPDHVAAGYVGMVGAGVVLLVGVDIWIRAAARTGLRRPPLAVMRAVRRERWTRARAGVAASSLVSFYVSYMAYRNLKAAVPLLRPEALFDLDLARADRWLFAGHDPATLLHSLLGTGLQTQVLSTVYVAFIVFLPLSLAAALVFSRELSTTLFVATALSINWILGAASYLLLPSLGPIYAEPSLFAHLPHSEVTHLQHVLMDQRVTYLRDPTSGTPQSIAAFASLHVAMSFTALLAAYLLALPRWLKRSLWVWMALTTLATIYLGWHYVVDDAAGIAIGGGAVVLAAALTGFELRPGRRGSRSRS
jgi:membrane-associated phospholipid phosphatase